MLSSDETLSDPVRSRGPVQAFELGLSLDSSEPEGDGDYSDGREEGDERWVFSYADMVTLLLLFFVMMFSVSEVNQEAMEEIQESLKTGKDSVTKELASKREQVFFERFGQDEIGGLSVHELLLQVKEQSKTPEEEILQSVEALLGHIHATQNMDSVHLRRTLKSFEEDLLQKKKTLESPNQTHASEVIFPVSHIFQGDSLELSAQGKQKISSLTRHLKKLSVTLLSVDVKVFDEREQSPLRSHVIRSVEDYTALRASRIGAALQEYGVSRRFLKFSGMGAGHPLAQPAERRNRRVSFTIRVESEAKPGDDLGSGIRQKADP